MGTFSDDLLSYTADDAELDRRDGLTPPAMPPAPTTRPITLAMPTTWPAPVHQFGEVVYLRGTTQHAWKVVGMRYDTHIREWFYQVRRDEHSAWEEEIAENLALSPWCEVCENFTADTFIAGVGYCCDCAAEAQPF